MDDKMKQAASAAGIPVVSKPSLNPTLLPTNLLPKKQGMTFEVGDGMNEKDTIIAQEKVRGIDPKDKIKAFEEIKVNTPQQLKDGLKSYLKDNIASGVLDKDTLKNNAKSYINKYVNENIIKKVDAARPKTVAGFIQNAKEDVSEVIDGFGALIGMGYKAAKAPIMDTLQAAWNLDYKELSEGDTVKGLSSALENTTKLITSPAYRTQVYNTYVKPIVDDYKEYRNPLQKIYEDPLGVAMDLTAVFSLAGKAVSTTGRIAESTKIVKAGENLSKVGEIASFKNVSNATKAVIKAMPGGEDMVRNWELAADVRKQLTKEQASFLATRNRTLNEIDKRVTAMSPEEVSILPKVVEGFVKAPTDATPAFYEALGMMKALANDQATFGLKLDRLTPEIIERRRFQPLAKWLEKENKIVPDSVPYENLTGSELQGYIKKIKEFFPDADPVYMRHFFEDNPKKFSSFFLNTTPVRSFKPGFLKKSMGKEGYIGSSSITKDQLKDVLGRQAVENLKWQRNIDLIEGFKNHPETKPLKKGEKPLPGYRVFAPDGMLKFYKGTVDLSAELQKQIATHQGDDIADLFGKVADNVFGKKDFIGVTKAKMYQVPDAMAKELEKITAATNPYVKLLYDKPLDAFRFAALSLYPRWLANNVVGNMLFSTLSGDVFNPKAFYIQNQAKKLGLLPDELFGGVQRAELTTSGKLGQASEVPLVRSTVAMHDALLNTKVVGHALNAIEGTVKNGVYKPLRAIGNTSLKINQAVDDMFKGSAYVNAALREERKGFIRRMTTSLEDSMKILEDLKGNPVKLEKVVDSVHDWYYHGANLTNFERRVVRRAIPFYSWMRWSAMYAYRIATEAPVRANIIANMARDFYSFTGQNQLPNELKGSVPIGTDEDGTVYYLQTRGVNPFGQINELLAGDGVWGNAFNMALKSSAPAIKTFAEQATGRDTFLDRTFTKEDIHEATNGMLWKFDPETGKIVQVEGKVRPSLTENLLRNYIPQYLLLETVLTGGQKRYTAEGLTTILKDIVKDPAEREAIVKDVITKQGEKKAKWGMELYKALGVSLNDVTSEDRMGKQKAKEAATSAIKNQLAPILNEDFKSNLKKEVMKQISKGATKDEIRAFVKLWVTRAVTDIENLGMKKEDMPEPKE